MSIFADKKKKMKKYKLKSVLAILFISSMLSFSCTNNQENESSSASSIDNNMEDLSKLDTIKIRLNSNDKMQFDQAELTAFEGQTVVLILHHIGTMPVTAMGHNFVLLTKGTSTSEFAKNASKAKANNYIPTDESNIIAYTGLIGGGESDTVVFKAPEKGVYDFLCSFPGHYSIMKGKFNIK